MVAQRGGGAWRLAAGGHWDRYRGIGRVGVGAVAIDVTHCDLSANLSRREEHCTVWKSDLYYFIIWSMRVAN